MDRLARYSRLIKGHLRRIEELVNKQPDPGVATLCVFDDKRRCYLIVRTGWSMDHPICAITLFLRIHNGKIWIEEDQTNYDIVDKLLEAGVPKRDIVLAFHSPRTRRMGEFAVA